MTDSFFADTSKWNGKVVDGSYPYEIFAFRADSGYATDPLAPANWRYCASAPKLRVVIVYVVFIPGQNAAVMSRLKALFGVKCPAKLVAEVDMESGKGFAGPGDHSAEANELVGLLEAWTGSGRRELEYGNKYDQASNWPSAPAWLKRITAAYSAGADPGTFGRQYTGGAGTPVPAGYPTGCPPFGDRVDMNVIHLGVDGIVEALGLGTVDGMLPADWVKLEGMLDAQRVKIEDDLIRRMLTGPDGRPHLVSTYAAEITAAVEAALKGARPAGDAVAVSGT